MNRVAMVHPGSSTDKVLPPAKKMAVLMGITLQTTDQGRLEIFILPYPTYPYGIANRVENN